MQSESRHLQATGKQNGAADVPPKYHKPCEHWSGCAREFAARAATLGGIAVAPDADAMVSDTASFRIVDCPHCGGMLKPDIVYFGESVPKARVDQAYSLVDAADALLVAGSSLTVYSGFRFVRHAAAKGMPIAIINRGPTRGDDLADVKIDNGCSPMLALLADELPALNVDRRTSAKELNAS